MAFSIESGKETGLIQINVTPKPLVLCQIAAINPATKAVDSGSDMVYLTTSPELGGITRVYSGNTYQARLIDNPIDQIQAQSSQGYDIPGSISLTIADGDFAIWSSHANAFGWRGGTLTVMFVLWDAPSDTYSTNAYVWPFILGKPTIEKVGEIKVSAQARQSMTRLDVPNFARQNMCGQPFPSTAAQRLDGLSNPTSPYWGCGYSPDIPFGVGNITTPNLMSPDGSPLTDSAGVYVTCDHTRSCGALKGTLTQGCMARQGNYAGTLAVDGDLTKDTSGRQTARFTGDTWLAPIGWQGKQYTNPSAGKLYGFNTPNPSTGTTYYNQGYGTQWVDATVLAPAGDPNSDRAECIVCMAPVGPGTILKVLVGGVEVQENNSDALFTYYLKSPGGRTGAVSQDAIYDGQGDPHGSTCWIEIVVPVELSQAGSVPNVQVLVQFPQCLHALPIATATTISGAVTITLPAGIPNIDCSGNPPFAVYVKGNSFLPDGAYNLASWTTGPPGTITLIGAAGTGTGTGGSIFYFPLNAADAGFADAKGGVAAANPVWALMDLLAMWGPFTVADFDTQTWYDAAQFCAEQISYRDLNGNVATHARYRCSLVLDNSNRQTMAKAVTGIRNCAGIILARNPANGLLQCFIEKTLADQQSAPVLGSNYNTAVSSLTAAGTTASGYLAYLFDGAGSIEKDTFKLGGDSLNATPNTVSIPFQDSENQWVKDSVTTVDPDGYVTSGNQEISAPLYFLGIENLDQATRRSNVELAKALYGNSRFDAGGTDLPSFRTTVKAAHLASRVGFICGINYEQLSL